MSDTPPAAPAAAPAAPPATPPPSPPPVPPAAGTPGDPDPLGAGGIKALEAERQARKDLERQVKELTPLATKAREIEEANKTEAQKLADELAAAKAAGATSTTGLMQLQVAMAKAPAGMPASKVAKLAQRLRGSTQAEMEADAAELFADFGGAIPPVTPGSPAGAGSTTPVENLQPGAMPPNTAQLTLPQQIAAAEAKGEYDKVRTLKSQQLFGLKDSK